MLKKISLGLIVAVIGFLAFVSTREGKFYYERSGAIKASPEKVFPYISQFKLGSLWSPFEKVDPNMKKQIKGNDGEVGAIMEFEGNSEAGSGHLELLKINPNESVDIKLTMTKPFAAENFITYKLTPTDDGTLFTWSMSGDGGFMGKLMGVLIDCDKMIGGQFEKGIANLKSVIEGSKMNLTENPEKIVFPESHYLFVEKIGPFMETAKVVWETAGKAAPEIGKKSKIIGAFSLYKMKPEMLYRAGFSLADKPADIPAGMKYEKFSGGNYLKYTLKGPYSQLPEASGRVHDLIKDNKIEMREGFFIENYVNDPASTPEADLITEILVPVK